LSLTAIGSKLNRLHSTVLHGIKAVEDRIPMERSLAEAVEWIETELKK
jgi:chromosomal replication initiation ATPase DnaA